MGISTQTEIVKSENASQECNGSVNEISWYGNKSFPFSVREAKDRGTVITGMPKSGKTNLAKMLVHHMMSLGYNVKVFDPSQAWLKSSVPYYLVMDSFMEVQDQAVLSPIDKSIVYDISRMYPEEQKLFIGIVIDSDFDLINDRSLVDVPHQWIIYVIEEAQMVIPSGSLRAKYAQQTFRMVSVGRNFNQRYFLLTQRPADISVKALSRSGQSYFGQHWEENDIRKISRLLGDKWSDNTPTPKSRKFNFVREILSGLKIGEFVYRNPYEKIQRKIATPLFDYTVEQVDIREIVKPKKKLSFWKKLAGFREE